MHVIPVWADPVGCTIDKNSSYTIMSISHKQQHYSCKLACSFQAALHVIPVWEDRWLHDSQDFIYTNMIQKNLLIMNNLLRMLSLSEQTLWAVR